MDLRTCKKLLAELPTLKDKGILDQESLDKLTAYLESNCDHKSNTGKLTVIFISIIGAMMIGGGICLLFAHNWDEMGRTVRAIISIIPLLAGIIIGFYVLSRKKSIAWKEGAGVFIFISFMASLGLVCQTYNLGGELSDFYFIVLLATLPLPWVLDSKGAATIWLTVLTCWVWTVHNWWHTDNDIYWFWLLLPLGGCYFVYAWLKNGIALRSYIAWILTVFFLCVLGPVLKTSNDSLVFSTYFAFFCILFMLGSIDKLSSQIRFSPFSSLGRAGALFMSLFAINSDALRHLAGHSFVIPLVITGVVAVVCLWRTIVRKRFELLIGLFPFLMTFIGSYNDYGRELPATVMTLLLAGLSGVMLWEGTKKQSMATLNSGMFLLCLIVIIKFAESDLPILIRGLLFICVGIIFLGVNLYLVIKRNKQRKLRMEEVK